MLKLLITNYIETECIFIDMDNIVADDWEVLGNADVKDLCISTLTFGEAISRLKRVQKVARKGWNGKNQYIELVPPGGTRITVSMRRTGTLIDL